MLLLGIDVETTGLDTENDYVTELGFIVYDTDARSHVKMGNECFRWPGMPALSDLIIDLTGITEAHLDTWAEPAEAEFMKLGTLMMECDYVVAHNAPFDKGMVTTAFKRLGLLMPDTPWIDTCVDLPYPQNIKSRNLNHTSADHQINPNRNPHRALFDVEQMFELLKKYNIDDVIKRAQSPNVTLQAVTRKPWEDPSPEGQKDNDKAKAAGFRWNGTEKKWLRAVKEFEAKDIVEAMPFPTRIIEQ